MWDVAFLWFQEQVEEMKKKEERMEKQMAEITAKNKMLAEPLQKAQDEVEELKKELANYEKDKETLRVSYQLHLHLMANSQTLDWEIFVAILFSTIIGND